MRHKIPKDWIWAKLADVCEIKNGRRQTEVINPNGKYPIYGSSGIFGYADEYLCEAGTTIIGRKGTINFPIFVNTKFWNVDTAFGLMPNSKYDNKLLYYFCKGFNFHTLDKSTTIPSLAKTDLLQIDVPVPPKQTQQTIVSKIEELFSELDKGIENLRLAQQQLKTYRQSVLKWAFEGKLTNANEDVPRNGLEPLSMAAEEQAEYGSKLPKGCRQLKLKDITLEKEGLRRGPFGSSIKKEFFVPAGYKVYEQGNAINDDPYRGSYYLREEKYHELANFKIKPHDLIVSCSGVTLGRITELPADAKPGVINQALLRIRLKKEIILNKYFIIQFRADFFQKKIFAQSQGTAMPNLVGIKDFKEIEMFVPSLDEQQKVIEAIESRFSVADKMEESINQSLQRAEALRQSILKKAFEGKLVATDTIETIKQTAKIVPFERKVLAGKIIHLLHDAGSFGLTKFQKIFYLVENFAEVPYETNFIQERAGPYDKEFTTAFRKEMQEEDWVQEEQKGMSTRFIPGENIGSLIVNYPKYFRDKGKDIVFVMKHLKDKSTHEAELIATLYAVWNNRLIKKKPVKISLLVEDFFNWSPKKKQEFGDEEVRAMYKWMKETNLTPKGFGKYIEPIPQV